MLGNTTAGPVRARVYTLHTPGAAGPRIHLALSLSKYPKTSIYEYDECDPRCVDAVVVSALRARTEPPAGMWEPTPAPSKICPVAWPGLPSVCVAFAKTRCIVGARRLRTASRSWSMTLPAAARRAAATSQFQWVSAWVRAPGESGPPSSGILLFSVLGKRQLRVFKASGARTEPQTPTRAHCPQALQPACTH